MGGNDAANHPRKPDFLKTVGEGFQAMRVYDVLCSKEKNGLILRVIPRDKRRFCCNLSNRRPKNAPAESSLTLISTGSSPQIGCTWLSDVIDVSLNLGSKSLFVRFTNIRRKTLQNSYYIKIIFGLLVIFFVENTFCLHLSSKLKN